MLPNSTTTPSLDQPSGRRPSTWLGRIGGRSLLALALGAVLAASLAPVALGVGDEPDATAPTVVQATGDNETIIAVAEAVSPAVVTIEVASDVSVDRMDPFMMPEGGFVMGFGSGVIIDPDGLILTNRHVVDGADEVTVTLADGSTYDGDVVGIDTYTDFALVRIDATDLPTAPLGDSSALKVGQLAVAIGNPLGRFQSSVSAGIVSGLDRSLDVSDLTTMSASRLRHLIQTDAAINPGNSGGALVDGDGNVIGINTAMAGGAQGIGFALPIDIAKPIIEQVRAGEDIARPWMGVVFQDIDAQLAKDEDLAVEEGAWIHNGQADGDAIVSDSPAAKAGLKDGDIITALGGQAIDSEHPLDLVLLTYEPETTVTVTVLRDGENVDLELTLGLRPADLGQ